MSSGPNERRRPKFCRDEARNTSPYAAVSARRRRSELVDKAAFPDEEARGHDEPREQADVVDDLAGFATWNGDRESVDGADEREQRRGHPECPRARPRQERRDGCDGQHEPEERLRRRRTREGDDRTETACGPRHDPQ